MKLLVYFDEIFNIIIIIYRTIKGIQYCQAFATGIDFKKKEIACADVYEHYENNVKLPRSKFNLSYDKLVLAVGMLEKSRHCSKFKKK